MNNNSSKKKISIATIVAIIAVIVSIVSIIVFVIFQINQDPNFSINLSNTSRTVEAGATFQETITVKDVHNFSGKTVTLSSTGQTDIIVTFETEKILLRQITHLQ